MRKYSLSSRYDIQLFGAEGEAGAGGESPAGQMEAALAQPQKGETQTPARRSGEAAPDPGEQKESAKERTDRFEALIKGEFKDLYDRRVQETIRRRLRGSEENARRLEALNPALEELGRRYGVDPADPEALSRAILAEVPEEEKAAPAADPREELARAKVADWLQQAEETRGLYPSFDLGQEAKDPRFRSLIGSGVPVQSAFELLHRDEILQASMDYSARRAEQRLAESVIAGKLRPAEGAMGGQSPVVTRRDVGSLTRAEREEIDRRVARGEKIRF